MASPSAAQPALPEEILEEIFLRLDAVADLARASAACTTFRRVVSTRRFLRRFRSLHPPPPGFLLGRSFHPAEPPHRASPAARALAQAADFTFSFLGDPDRWKVRDGRVLLSRRISSTAAFEDLVVCDPLHRRYVELPPIPDDLAAATRSWVWGMQDFDPFLAPGSEEGDDSDLSFRVICGVNGRHELLSFHFSSVTVKWRDVSFILLMRRAPYFKCFECYYAHGRFFWMLDHIDSSMFMLDMHEMELSTVDIPSRIFGTSHTIVEAGESRVGLFYHHEPKMLDLYSKTLRKNGVDAEEWQHKRIPLPEIDWYWRILGQADGCLLLRAAPRVTPQAWYFTLDPKTMLFERLCVLDRRRVAPNAQLYASFPPPFSLPSI